jgi:Spy/CpxP family protein refolding chaperone
MKANYLLMVLVGSLGVCTALAQPAPDNGRALGEVKDRMAKYEAMRQATAWGNEGPDEGLIIGLLYQPRAREELGITEEQTSRLQEGLSGVRKQTAELRPQLEQAAMEQARMMTATDVDEAALLAQVEKTGKIRTDIAKLRVKTLLILKTVLTPEQVEKIKTRLLVRPERFRDAAGVAAPRGGDGAQTYGRPREGRGGQGLVPLPQKAPRPRENHETL